MGWHWDHVRTAWRRALSLNQYTAAMNYFYIWAARSDLISEKTAAGFYETRIPNGFSRDRLLPGLGPSPGQFGSRKSKKPRNRSMNLGVKSLLETTTNRRDRFLVGSKGGRPTSQCGSAGRS